ncbi:MAG: biotin transporter BioY [Clostridiaceae bacterium]|nr:biotin transporter BioY [Clostridiaceae bacterium]
MERMKTKNLAFCALMAAVTAVCAQISIPLPGGMPLTLSVAAVYLSGAFLGPGLAFASQLVYLLLGAFGLPVFAGFSGSLGVLLGSTGGYLLVYPLMAAAVALGRRLWGGKLPSLAASMLIALLLCYAGGTAWFMAVTQKSLAVSLAACVFPFVPVDLCKIALASAVGSRLAVFTERAD